MPVPARSFFILFLNLTTAWAQSETDSSCLDPNNGGPDNKADCCAGSGNGQAQVGDTLFEYTCNSYANNYGAAPLGAANAYKCAELCSQDTTCHAASWQPHSGGSGGDCWLSSAGFHLTPDPYKSWVVLVNTGRAGHVVNPEPTPPANCDCDSEVEKANHECTSEKEALSANHEKECQDKVKENVDKCQQTAETKCESEKILLDQALKAECDQKLAALKPQPDIWATCPPNAIKHASAAGQNWKIWCVQHWTDNSNVLKANAQSLKHCAQICAGLSACKSAIYGWANDSHHSKCWLKVNLRVSGVPDFRNDPNNRSWHVISKLE